MAGFGGESLTQPSPKEKVLKIKRERSKKNIYPLYNFKAANQSPLLWRGFR
jgi:hypothetical protein